MRHGRAASFLCTFFFFRYQKYAFSCGIICVTDNVLRRQMIKDQLCPCCLPRRTDHLPLPEQSSSLLSSSSTEKKIYLKTEMRPLESLRPGTVVSRSTKTRSSSVNSTQTSFTGGRMVAEDLRCGQLPRAELPRASGEGPLGLHFFTITAAIVISDLRTTPVRCECVKGVTVCTACVEVPSI